MNKINLVILLFISTLFSACENYKDFNGIVDFAEKQTKFMLNEIGNCNGQYPRSTKDSRLVTTDIYGWTSGFFPGELWLLYELTGKEYWKNEAEEWTFPLNKNQFNTKDHDVGFIVNNSFGHGYRLTNNQKYKDIIIQTANSLIKRYNPIIKSLKSWEGGKAHNDTTIWKFPVIIDNMMNLELLFNASKITGNKKYYNIAVSHANTTIKNHLRPDYSCFHVVDYDTITGNIHDKATAQGFADNSAWSRGQAWGIYGFTMVYRETHDIKYLNIAQNMANFYINHPNLPEDNIPFWDFNANENGYNKEWKFDDSIIGYIPRDASAAAITASALLELYTFTNNKKYFNFAKETIKTLSSPQYTSKLKENCGFILKHSTGSLPHGKEIDVPLIYADYYYLEAIMRYKAIKNNK